MTKTMVMLHKKPSKRLQTFVVGFAIGVGVSIVIGLWDEATIIYRIALLLLPGIPLYFGWELTKSNDK
jgi:hypothetical protein